MAGDVVSAGTLVAAILEQSGYLTQGDFLIAFKSFFRDAGALVYFIGAVGGVLSLVLFGSFRAARYLIFGPAIYWALVGPTVEIDGVVAKLGGGEARGFVGDKGEAQAKADRDQVMEKAGVQSGRPIKVAEGFWLFARPINEFVNEFIDVMLKDEDGENLMVEHKVRGLELIARSLPQSPESISMLEQELLVYCPRIYQSALGIAQNYIKTRAVEGIAKGPTLPDGGKLKENRDKKWAQFLSEGESEHININATETPHLHKYIETNGTNAAARHAKRAFDRGLSEPIPCAMAWDVFLEILWHSASKHMPNIIQLTTGAWVGPEANEKACQHLTSKLYDDAPVENGTGALCDIQPGVALSLLANHLGYMDTFQRVLKRHSLADDPLNPKAHSAIVASNRLAAENVDSLNQASLMLGHAAIGMPIGMVVSSAKLKDDAGHSYSVTDYAPAVNMHLIEGVTSTEQVSVPIYQMTEARKSLYSRSLQLPYYQGICLYLIAISYPFLALLVLLPGKAQVFINVPFAWLWIKSWDIGFAAVILLERVMYNLLPNWSVAPQLRTTESWDWYKLPIVLGEGFNFNHVQNVAQYYTILGMATAGIPAITGVIVLKSKRAILGNFVGAIDNLARDAGQRESGSYSIAASNQRSEIRSRIEGFARQIPILGAGGVEGGLRGFTGGYFGTAKAVSEVPMMLSGEWSSQAAKTNLQRAVGGASSIVGAYLGAYKEHVISEVSYESKHTAVFDLIVGRYGDLQRAADGKAAADDGAGTRLSGGFETNAPKENSFDELKAHGLRRVKFLLDMEQKQAETEGVIIGEAISAKGPAATERFVAGMLLGSIGKDMVGNEMRLQDLELRPEIKGMFTKIDISKEDPKSLVDYVTKQIADVAKDKGLTTSSNESIFWQPLFNEYRETYGHTGYSEAAEFQRLFITSASNMYIKDPAERQEMLQELEGRRGGIADYLRFGLSDQVQNALATVPGGASSQPFIGFGGSRYVQEAGSTGDLSNFNPRTLTDGYQASLKGMEAFGKIIGHNFPNEKEILHESRIASDTALRTADPKLYEERQVESMNYLFSLEYVRETYSSNGREIPSDILPKLIEVAKQKEQQLNNDLGDKNHFRLPDNIEAFSKENPLLAYQGLENFFEGFEAAQRTSNAVREMRTQMEDGSMPIFGQPSDIMRSNRPKRKDEARW